MKPGYLCNFCFAAGFLAIGYVLGSTESYSPQQVKAQDQKLTDESVTKVRAALEALEIAKGSLMGEGVYTPATEGTNSFAIVSGGLNAIEDLEKGTGVDPETFAALYADRAVEQVAEHIGKDELGRLTYKNKVIRIYALSRLKKMYADRDEILGKNNLE